MEVVDVSNSGLLVEGHMRLLPGTHVDVHIVTGEGRTLVRSRVARCCVCALQADMVRYRGALAFDRFVDTRQLGYVVPERVPSVAPDLGSRYPVEPAPRERPIEQRLSAWALGDQP
jgi:hypothetical protein